MPPSSLFLENVRQTRNASTLDMLKGYCSYAERLLHKLQCFRQAFSNYRDVTLCAAKGKYPVRAVLRRNSNVLSLDKFQLSLVAAIEASFVSNKYDVSQMSYDLSKDVVVHSLDVHPPTLSGRGLCKTSKNNARIELAGGVTNGDFVSIFLNGEYASLPVDGSTVVDIGANIGDSALYFALRGARRIIALEPFPTNYELAKRNIEFNGFEEKIVLINAGCAGHISAGSEITIDPNHMGNAISVLRDFDNGVHVPLLSLDQIVRQYNIGAPSVLKMDCEGCEYETIITASPETLRRFQYIWIEYHVGYKNLKQKLEQCGFEVAASVPKFDPRDFSFFRKKSKKMYAGAIYCTLK